ncbi:MAG: ABC transporter ATP-binding protein [Phycisphaerales bacterium]|nr:ABC transporter ATP-binding protein [Phycisphaerales bacterium]
MNGHTNQGASLETATSPHMLSVCVLKKSYGNAAILQGVSLHVASGEIVGLVGPNGAGKTTLLKCILGVIQADEGAIDVCGVDAIRNSLAARKLIGYAPSETSLYHRLRAGELLDFATRFHPQADRTAGLALLDELGVPRRRRVGALSHGMKRKVLLAQALSSGAPLLILDEPMEAFDPAARQVAVDLLREATATGRAILCSSHDLASTERLCDRVAFLRSGQVIREGPTSDLLAETSRVVHLTLRRPAEQSDLPKVEGWQWSGGGTNWILLHDAAPEAVLPALAALPIASIQSGGSLDEIFGALYQEPNA